MTKGLNNMEKYIHAKEDFKNNHFNLKKDSDYLIVNEETDAYVFENEDGSINQIAKGYLKDQKQLSIVSR